MLENVVNFRNGVTAKTVELPLLLRALKHKVTSGEKARKVGVCVYKNEHFERVFNAVF